MPHVVPGRPLALGLILCLLAPAVTFVCGCRSADEAGPGPLRWTKAETSPLLSSDVTLRASYYPCMSPTVYDTYAFLNGRKIGTLDELRHHVVPLDTEAKALAYRDLLAEVRLEGDDDVFPLAHGHSLTYRPAFRQWMTEYGDAEVARWDVAKERKITQHADRFEIVEVQYRHIPDRSPPEPNIVKVGTEAVELVLETIHTDGRYERTVLRTLLHGHEASKYGPAPLL